MTGKTRKVLLLEFNELVPSLLDKFMRQGALPNFKQFYDRSAIFVTQSDEVETPNLEPWIQWYSLHTGLPFEEHGVFRLTDGLHQDHVDLWHAARDAGLRVGNMSSMNARPFESDSGFYVPDPWCGKAHCRPAELDDYHQFVSSAVQQYANPNDQALRQAWNFLYFLMRHGLKMSTMMKVSSQLVEERLNADRKWRRVSLLDLIQADVFQYYYEREQPDLATFFVNSTAHYQHAYWRDMDPSAFGDVNSAADADKKSGYEDAVLYGYQSMDRLLERFFELESEYGVTLVLATALSQQPYFDPQIPQGRLFYRANDLLGYLRSANIVPESFEPTMTNQYRIRFENAEFARQAEDFLHGHFVNGEAVFDVTNDNAHLYVDVPIHDDVPTDSVITSTRSNEVQDFFDFFHVIDARKSGKHHPHGVLWIKSGEHLDCSNELVSILDVFPTMLDLLDVPLPSGVRYRGSSLRPRLSSLRQQVA